MSLLNRIKDIWHIVFHSSEIKLRISALEDISKISQHWLIILNQLEWYVKNGYNISFFLNESNKMEANLEINGEIKKTTEGDDFREILSVFSSIHTDDRCDIDYCAKELMADMIELDVDGNPKGKKDKKIVDQYSDPKNPNYGNNDPSVTTLRKSIKLIVEDSKNGRDE